MFKRILILVGVVGFSLTLLGLMGLTIETAPAVSHCTSPLP